MKIFSAPQIKEWDQFTISGEPITSLGLMERAANACVQWLVENYSSCTFYIFCGPGNNGGDGLAIARLLHHRSFKVKVYVLGAAKHSFDFDANLQQLPVDAITIHTADDFPAIENNAVVVDALFGTGLNKILNNTAAELVVYLNNTESPVISIDMPSGMFADSSSKNNAIIKATHTLSFQCSKLAFMMTDNLVYTGKVDILDIGLQHNYYDATDTDLFTIDARLIKSIYQPRADWAHKYNAGHALVYAGSKNMMGAAFLCSKACMRTGAGLVTLYIAPEQMHILHTAIPEIVASDENDFAVITHKKNCVAFGPGLEINDANQFLLEEMLQQWKGMLVIDASGLSLLKSSLSLLRKRPASSTVLTPHTGEFEKLFGKCDNDFERMQLALQKAMEFNIYIILKAPHTLVACPDGEAYFNTTGNSGMATAGSGDVLTGIITALLAQNYPVKNACLFGVYLHGLAGDVAAENLSKEAMIASDIIENIGAGYKKIMA